MQKLFIIGLYVLIGANNTGFSQSSISQQDSVKRIDSFFIHGDVKVTIDRPVHRTQRGELREKLIENKFISWPAWKQRHPDFKILIPHLVDSLSEHHQAR